MIAGMLAQRIQQQFIDSADLMYQCAQVLTPAIEAATGAVLASVTSGGKVLACGNGPASGLVQAFAAAFVGRFERDRPELAAFALGTNAAVLTDVSFGFEARNVFSRQVRALGLPGDVLLVVTLQPDAPDILGAVEAAHEREMTVVALCGAQAARLGQMLKDTDVLVCVPSERPARVQEAQQLALHCICDGVDVQLLGDDAEPEEYSA
jgi:D-sedoheptulose 7-phosphate isomerase